MVVRDIMTTEVVSVQETDTLLDAAMIFARSTLRHLPVLRDQKVVGIITQRELQSYAPGLLSGVTSEQYQKVMETTSIARVMARNLHTVKPDQPNQQSQTAPPPEQGVQAKPPGFDTDAWFTAYAPVRRPKVVVCVLIVHGGAGGSTAAPAARGVLQAGLTR